MKKNIYIYTFKAGIAELKVEVCCSYSGIKNNLKGKPFVFFVFFYTFT